MRIQEGVSPGLEVGTSLRKPPRLVSEPGANEALEAVCRLFSWAHVTVRYRWSDDQHGWLRRSSWRATHRQWSG